MKSTINFLVFIFVLLTQGFFLTETKFAAAQSTAESWKNFYGIVWDGTPEGNIRFARQMGHDYIGIQRSPRYYINNQAVAGLKYYVDNPRGRIYSSFGYSKTINLSRVTDSDLTNDYTEEEKNFYEKNVVWKSHDPFPYNLATGWWHSSSEFSVIWDFQQQAVIDMVVEEIMALFRSYEDRDLPFTFAGFIDDVPHLGGDFNIWDNTRTGNRGVKLSYWTGTDSGLIHGGITHEYATFEDGVAAYYKKLNARMRQEFPDAKWIAEPTALYSTSSTNEYIYSTSQRADRDELTPDMLFSEGPNTAFVDDERNFNSGMNITRDMVGISQCQRGNEPDNRLFAGKAGINGAWYVHLWRWGGANGDGENEWSDITQVYPRQKLIRYLPNWDNLNGVPLSSRSWNGSVYQSTHSFASSDVIYSRQPNTGKLFAVFLTRNGVIRLNADETITSMRHVNGYFEETTDASADFDITGSEIRLRSSVTIDIDTSNGKVMGNGYIFTLSSGGSPKVTTESATNVTSNSAMLNGTVNASGLTTTAWFEYGMTSGSYESKSTTQSISGSSDTAVSFNIGGLSTATTYYYRLVAQNGAGTTYGNEMSFTTLDTTAPNCSISINGGNSYTNSAIVTLALSATDNVGVTGYYLSTSSAIPLASASGWTTISSTTSFNGSVQYTLSNGDGNKTVYVWYKDADGNVSNTASDSITLDTTNPLITITSPTSSSTYTATNSTISLGGSASDDTSGVSSVAWSNNRGGSGTASGTANWSISGISLSSGENIITVTARDGANNTMTDTITVNYGVAPKTTTGLPTNVTANSAMLNGTVNGNGLTTTAWFEYGVTSGSYGSKSTTQSISGSSDTAVSFSIGGLSTATTYYYRLVGQNSAGTTYGSEMSFTTITLDTTAPNCSVSINGGNSYTSSATATLALSATDNVGVTGYYLSASSAIPLASASGWTTISSITSFNASVQYTLSNGDGNKMVYVWYKDAAGNVSNTASDSITLDTTNPLITITSPTSNDTYKTTSNTISLGGSTSDGTSGVRNVAWSNDRGGSGTASGTTTWTISDISLSSGRNIITVTVSDGANNAMTDTITVNYHIPPNGSISINNGDTHTNSTSVTLALSAADNIGVAGYYLSTSPEIPLPWASGWTTISSTTSFSASVSYTLSSGDGSKTVYVWYKDGAGNLSDTASDAITLDTTNPMVTITSPTSNATYRSRNSTINLGGNASDSASGVSRVTWRNNRGGSGTASGTTSWSISGISLSRGDNIITVTATDRANNTRTDTITVTR